MAINLFGLRLTLDAEPKLVPSPGIEQTRWVTRLEGNELVLDIRLRIRRSHTLTVRGTFHIRQFDAGQWGFVSSANDGVFQLSDEDGWDANPFELKLGWLSIRDPYVKYVPTDEGLLTVDIPNQGFVLSRQLPISVSTNGAVAGISLALTAESGFPIEHSSVPGIVFKPGSFDAETFASTHVGRRVRQYFKRSWHTKALTLPLCLSAGWTDLDLRAGSKVATEQEAIVPLHTFRWPSTRNVSPAIGAIVQQMKLSLAQHSGRTVLTEMKMPSGTLRNYSYHDQQFAPLDLRFASPISLAIQPLRSQQHVASLLLQSSLDDGTHQAISVKRQNDSLSFVGLRSGMRTPVVRQSKIIVQDEDPFPAPSIVGVDPRLLRNATGPVLSPSSLSKIEYALPGEAYISQTSKVRTWQFKGNGGLLGLLPDVATRRLNDFERRYQHRINESLTTYEDSVTPVIHESNLVQGKESEQDVVRLERLLSPTKAPTFSSYDTSYEFGSVKVTHQWSGGVDQDHFLIFSDDANNDSSITFSEAFQLDPTSRGDQQIRIAQSAPMGIPADVGTIQACVKLQRGRRLEDLLKEGGAIPAHLESMLEVLPEVVKDRDWIGLVVFRQTVDFSEFPLLGSLVEEEAQLQYLAITPPVPSGTQDDFSVYARLIYKNANSSVPHPGAKDGQGDSSENQQREVYAQMRSLDVTWADRRLSKFHSETMIRIRSCLGLAKKEGDSSQISPTVIDVVGAIDRDSGDIKFLARSSQPVGILPKTGFGPVKQIYLSKVEIIRINEKTKVDIDGDVKLKPQEIDGDSWFTASDGDAVKFKGFGFWFRQLSGGGDWLKFDYPSFRFQPGDGGFSLLNLPFLKVKLKGLGIDFPKSSFSWNSMVKIVEGWEDWDDVGVRKFVGRFRLGFELAKLPFLSSKPFKELTFDFEIGIPLKDAFTFDESKLRLYLSAVGFNKLNLDLMRFLTIRADRVRLEAKEIEGQNVPWFLFEKVDVLILRKTVVDDLTFAYFSIPDGQRGFLGLIEQDVDSLPLIRVDWILVGKNLSIPSDLAKAVVSVQPSAEDEIRKQISRAYDENKLIPLSADSKKSVGEWIFAAGIDVLDGFLIGKFIFHDGAYYGISLDGQMLKEWFGWDFAISVLYIQRDRPEEDSFYIQIRLPMFTFGAFTFKGGVVALEIQMNGGFLLDIGFPWLDADGIRNWDRSQGVFVSGLMGKGGMYIAKRSAVKVYKDENQKLVMFAAGQAAMVGIGGAYSKGPFRVEAYAGIYIVGEGALLFRRSSVVGLRLVGSVGIQVRGIGELNWWIISIRIDVVIGAEARLTLRWGLEFNPATGHIENPGENDPSESIVVQLDFVLYARVSARACIGKGWFKVCKRVRAGVSLPYRQKLRIGV